MDLRDASGDIIHFAEDDIVKDPTDLEDEIKRAEKRSFSRFFLKRLHVQQRGFTRKQRTNKHLVKGGPRQKGSGFYQSPKKYDDNAPACRIYGSALVKKVTGNLHITSFVPVFMAVYGHENEYGVDMSHVIHEFSFGDYFPQIAEPLDASFEMSHIPGAAYQYFISVVPTHYMHGRHEVYTNQYSVNDYQRNPEGAAAFPGLYFKYDIEPLTMKVKKQSKSLIAFIVRLCSVLGGLWICTDLGMRVLARLMPLIRRRMSDGIVSDSGMTEPMTPSQYASPYFSGPMDPSPHQHGAYGTTSTANYMTHASSETKYRATSY